MRHLQKRKSLLMSALLFVTPASAWAACPDPIHQQAVQTSLDEVAHSYASADFEQAYAQLAQLEGRLKCQASVIPGALLHRLYQLKGAVAVATGADAYAEEAFEQALLITPAVGWDETLGSQAGKLWENRRGIIKQRLGASLRVTQLPRGVELALDGQRLKEDSIRQVTGGTHLVQVTVDGGPWEQHPIVIPAGFAWQVAWQGEELLVLPERTNAASRTVVGAAVTATFGLSTAVSAGIYVPAYLDCLNSCEEQVLGRGLRARDVFISSMTATVLSAGFTWLLPAVFPDELARHKRIPKVSLSLTSDTELPLTLGLSLSWPR